MTTLQNFPMVSQLTTVTSDGRVSEDAQFECVPASIGAAILWYEGKSQWDQNVNPDLLKDAAYGEAWRNMGTAASAYVGIVAKMGFKLWHFDGIPGALVSEVHKQLQSEHPVIFTEPDPYVSSSLGWSHVCVFKEEEPGYLTAMDPYIAKPVRRTDQEWTNLLQFNQIWILEKEENDVPPPLTITNPVAAAYYTQTSSTSWHCIKTNKVIQGAILAHYQTCGATELHGLEELGLCVSNEIPIEKIDPIYQHLAGSGIVIQFYERGVLIYDPKHVVDNPPGAGSVYRAHLWGLPGQDPLIKELQAEIAQLKAQRSDTSALQALQAELDAEKAKEQSAKTALQAVVAGL